MILWNIHYIHVIKYVVAIKNDSLLIFTWHKVCSYLHDKYFLISETKSKLPVYIFYKAKYFQAFHYYCKLVRHCRSRTEKVLKSKDRGNVITENVFIKIGIMGEFTDDDLKLISKRSGNIAKCVLKLRFRCLLYFLFF